MRRLDVFARVALLLAGCAFIFTACGGGNTSSSNNTNTGASKASVALVTDKGGLNDQSFNHLAFQGYTKAMNEFGFTKQVIESKNESDYIKNLTTAAQGADLVFAVGFLMQQAVYEVATQFPDKKFAIIDGCAVPAGKSECATLPNVAPLYFSEQEAGCLVGAIAAQMELDGKSKIPELRGKNTIGVVAGESIPPVNRYIAGYKYCAKQVNEKINVLVTYTQDFQATAKCKDAALSMINQHQADIIFQDAGGCGVGALDAAEQEGVFSIGVDADQSQVNKSVITSAVKRVDTSVYATVKDFVNGKFSNNPPLFDLAHDGVGYAPVSDKVPADAKAKADELAKKIKDGSLKVPSEIPA
uniref:BMP family ABC transporter substrate-binding protein n=1 Tax=Thermosporothrix sp. COM3 TaxID=2490863 RepID=A0A455SES3_9CHLR|nr:BMP family ABC transporter substrate-binding protein [Thermosporothrix sp. COM3]